MQTLIKTILAIMFMTSLSWAESTVIVIGQPVTTGGSITYLLNENFNATGAPTNWYAEGTYSYDSTTDPIEGVQSLTLTADGAGVYTPTVSQLTLNTSLATYIQFAFEPDQLPSGNQGLFAITGLRGSIEINNTGRLRVSTVGGTPVTVESVFSSGTTIYIRAKYTPGTGTNGQFRVWTSADGNTWTERANITDDTTVGYPGSGSNFCYWYTGNSLQSTIDSVLIWQE